MIIGAILIAVGGLYFYLMLKGYQDDWKTISNRIAEAEPEQGEEAEDTTSRMEPVSGF